MARDLGFTLWPDQWHLFNEGQTGGTPGIDINVLPVWQDYRGEGVRVLVLDTGIDTTHPDLVGNYLADKAFEFTTNTVDGSYTHMPEWHWHGTFVSGLIAADGAGTGVRGVAFEAKFSAYVNFNGADARTAFAKAADAGFDVMNNSWGNDLAFVDTFKNYPQALESMTHAVATGRDGLGMNIVVSAGNSYNFARAYREIGYEWSGQFPLADANMSSTQNSRFSITVGALDAFGTYGDGDDALGYTTPGAPVLISAPGTDVVSADIQGTGEGTMGPDDYGTNSGTSFSAPVVSGVIALMLEANPLLGYRDVKEILAYSARFIDAEEPSWAVNAAINHNGGGLLSNDNYGFGMVDATAAVRLAETWHKQSVYANEMHVGNGGTVNADAIPDGSGALEYTFELAEGVSVETMELDVWITHAEFGDLVIELISPNGTSSMLLYRVGDGRTTELTKAFFELRGIVQDMTELQHTLTSNDFMGETSAGTWTVRISDEKLGDTGNVHGLNLRAYGSEATQDQTYIYTNDFAQTATYDASRTVLSNATGVHTLNLAAVTDAVRVDLSRGSAQIAGVEVTIDADTKVGKVLTGDGADIVTLASAGGDVALGRGNDTAIVSAVGTVDGGAGFDRIVLSSARDQFSIVAKDGAVSLSHKDSGDLVTAKDVQYYAFGEAAADILIVTASAAEAQLARLYDLMFGRAADFDGLGYWVGRYVDGAGLGAIASSFSASSEFDSIGAQLSADAFVSLLYTQMLGRSADDNGASYWIDKINGGSDRNEIAASFALSDEAGRIEIDHVRLIGTTAETIIA